MITKESFLKSLQSLVREAEHKKFLLAVSGGADSMVLLNLFQRLDLNFEVAHFNYRLRGEDSDLDEKIVADFCFKNNIELHLYQVSEKEQKPKNSIQIWARNLRYEFFFKILKQKNFDFIVTAHHLNDELETFIINLSRGSGIKGLSGIPASENKILRPLLRFSKQEIYDFANESGIEFREDASNQKNDYLRNGIRNKVIPVLSEISPDFLSGFKDSLIYLNEANKFLQTTVDEALNDVTIRKNEQETALNKTKLLENNQFIIVEIIRKFGFSGDEIEKVIAAENGKFFRSKTHELKITRNQILCYPRRQSQS